MCEGGCRTSQPHVRKDASRRSRRESAPLLVAGSRVLVLPPVAAVVLQILPILMEIPPVVPDGPGILVEGRPILAECLPVFGAGGTVLLERMAILLEGRPIGGDGGLVPGLPIRLELLPVLPLLLPGLPDGLVIFPERLGILPEVLPILCDGLLVLPEVLPILSNILPILLAGRLAWRGLRVGWLSLLGILRVRPRDPQGQGHETS